MLTCSILVVVAFVRAEGPSFLNRVINNAGGTANAATQQVYLTTYP